MKKIILVLTAVALATLAFVFTPASARAQTTCTQVYPGAGQYALCNYPPYSIENDVWNPTTGSTQTLTATSAADWTVTGSEPDDPAYTVHSYPDVRYSVPYIPLSGLNQVHQDFSLYNWPKNDSNWEMAADDWMNDNGVNTEIMVWEDTWNELPNGNGDIASIVVGGQVFDVYENPGQINGPEFAFVSVKNITHGTVNLGPMLRWLANNGYISYSATLYSLQYGMEVWGTHSTPVSWVFNGYDATVTTNS
jgi:hypothetical protein